MTGPADPPVKPQLDPTPPPSSSGSSHVCVPAESRASVLLPPGARVVSRVKTATDHDWSDNSMKYIPILGLLLVAACSDDTTTPPAPPPVATITVGGSSSLVAGETDQFTVILKDASGNTLTGRDVAWSSSLSSVATVNTAGLVTAVATGNATITATSEGKTGSLAVQVGSDVASVTLTGCATALVPPATCALTATPKNGAGDPLTGRIVTWSSDNIAAATVDADGMVTAVAFGQATVTATVEGQSATSVVQVGTDVATVTVTGCEGVVAGEQCTLAAASADAGGTDLPGRTATWASDNLAVATVDAGGVVTAVAAGEAMITATVEGVDGTATVQVATDVATVTVTGCAAVVVGQQCALTAAAQNAGGIDLTGRTVTWVSDNLAVATVDATGMVTAVSAGQANVTATIEGIDGVATLQVTAGP